MIRLMFAVAALLALAAVGVLGWRFLAPQVLAGAAGEAAPERVAVLEHRLVLVEEDNAALQARLDVLEARLAALTAPSERAPATTSPLVRDLGGYDEPMLLTSPRRLNEGLSPLRVASLLDVFGMPASDLDQTCRPPTSPALLALLDTRDVGPFRTRMLRPALDSLERIFERVGESYPDLIGQLRTYGGLCARLIRGSTDGVSRHAFGLAVDVSIGGTLDRLGDGRTQFGLMVLSDFFREEGWIWGAAWRREDSMHFEVSAELFEEWREAGLLELPEGIEPLPVVEAEAEAYAPGEAVER